MTANLPDPLPASDAVAVALAWMHTPVPRLTPAEL